MGGRATWRKQTNQWMVVKGTFGVLVATSSAPDDVKVRLEANVPEEFTFAP